MNFKFLLSVVFLFIFVSTNSNAFHCGIIHVEVVEQEALVPETDTKKIKIQVLTKTMNGYSVGLPYTTISELIQFLDSLKWPIIIETENQLLINKIRSKFGEIRTIFIAKNSVPTKESVTETYEMVKSITSLKKPYFFIYHIETTEVESQPTGHPLVPIPQIGKPKTLYYVIRVSPPIETREGGPFQPYNPQ